MSITFMFFVLSLTLWAFTFLYLRSFIIKKTSKDRILAEFREEIDRLITDIDAATDRDIALIEDRVKTLKNLLEETDKRILAYKKEVHRKVMEEQAYAELGRRQGRPVIKTEIVETDTPISKPRFIRSESEIKPKAPTFSERVMELYQAGFSPELIANKLKVTVAEVDLAINVSGKKRSPKGS